MADDAHVPVLRDRVLALLAPAVEQVGAVAVDATVGLGGHAEAMLETFPGLRVVGLDRDRQALVRSHERLIPYADRLTLVHAIYDELPQVMSRLGLERVQGVLFDLGVSSMQLDVTQRGFSYARETPLDMRMDQSSGLTAADVLNTYPAEDLARILRDYGEERFARRIADRVVRERRNEPFTSSGRLVDLVRAAERTAA
jgi:16S rRNA (cytosine1402-N4)-methyltransferase